MTHPEPGTASFWWLGHAGFVVQGPESGPIAVDPYLSDSFAKAGGFSRQYPPPLSPVGLRISALFLTHDHLDHTDPETLPELCAANPEARIYAPPPSAASLSRLGITGDRVTILRRGDTVYGDGFHVHAVPAQHTEDSVGLVFVFDNGPCLYHPSDTQYFDNLISSIKSQKWGVTALTLHIDDTWGDLPTETAVALTNALAPREVIPLHWGMFAETSADPRRFAALLAASGSCVRPVILSPEGNARHTICTGG